MQIVCNILTEKGEEGGNGESFVAVSKYFEIYSPSIVEERKEGDDGVNRNHKEDPDNTVGLSVCASRLSAS